MPFGRLLSDTEPFIWLPAEQNWQQRSSSSNCSVMYIQILVFKKSMQVPEVQVCLMCVDKNHFLGYHTTLQVYSML